MKSESKFVRLAALLLIYLLILFLGSSCTVLQRDYADTGRIRLKEKMVVDKSIRFLIVEVDGCQYLSNDFYGGLIHLETCPNSIHPKTNNRYANNKN